MFPPRRTAASLLTSLLAVGCVLCLGPIASAHSVPKNTYDRIVEVRLLQPQPSTLKVVVAYRLEVDEYTVMTRQMAPFLTKVDLSREQDKRNAFYREFTRIFAPILADNLSAELDGQTLTFVCVQRQHALDDEKGTPLGHLRCDFVFEAQAKTAPPKEHLFVFREGNYELEAGRIDVALVAGQGVRLSRVKQATPALKQKKFLAPGEEEQLRKVSARLAPAVLTAQPTATVPPANTTPPGPGAKVPGGRESGRAKVAGWITLAAAQQRAQPGAPDKRQQDTPPRANDSAPAPKTEASTGPPNPSSESGSVTSAVSDAERWSVDFWSLLDPRQVFWVALILATAMGAVHALTPGHGKTLVAAYLVGNHGTIVHALVLGLVTTLTHTGIVLLAAVAVNFLPDAWIKSVLQIVQIIFGLMIAGIGFWLLVCRLSGRADHVHIGGHSHAHHHHPGHHHHEHHVHAAGEHHHHHHGPHVHDHTHDHNHEEHDHAHADHTHDEHGQMVPRVGRKPALSWWGLVLLGMQGGIVPCWEAVAWLFVMVAQGRLGWALPVVLAFSAGLAATLVGIGIAVVAASRFAQSRWGTGRVVQALPVVSACLVIAMGMWLFYDSVHGFPR